MDNKKVVSTLNELIETCRDSQNGVKEASENVKSLDLKSFFNQVSADRTQFVKELQLEVRRLGGEPEKTGSTLAAIHRAWADIEGTLVGKNDQLILSECEKAEDSIVDAYKQALKTGLPTNILPTVERQFQSIQQVHNRVKQMRDSKAATSGR